MSEHVELAKRLRNPALTATREESAEAIETLQAQVERLKGKVESLKHDIARHVQIATDLNSEVERLKGETARLSEIVSLLANSDDPHVRNSVLNFLEDRSALEAKP